PPARGGADEDDMGTGGSGGDAEEGCAQSTSPLSPSALLILFALLFFRSRGGRRRDLLELR
ncbi:MAG: hypothetical protein VYD19_07290, partial [Myxococcota bacterium]|nr:hypothetical protein [Myxococcota bacterium]